jgi:phage repressor protein C with HTH and peptisase S24 domain
LALGRATRLDRWPWRRVRVRGPSMSPCLADGDVVLVRFGASPAPGAVVLVRWAARPGQLSVKRAVRPDGVDWFVVGDNPFGSTDSRDLGPATVIGVVRWRLWPRPGRIPAGCR